MYVESCVILVVCGSFIETHRGTRQTTGLYGLKYDSATACGLPLYLCSYKLVGSATKSIPEETCVRVREGENPNLNSTALLQAFTGHHFT